MLLNKMQKKSVHRCLLLNKHHISPEFHHELTCEQCFTPVKYCFLNKKAFDMLIF